MSVSREQLIEELRASREYREAYAEGYLNHSLTAQIRLVREQRGLSQKELAAKIGKHQPGLSRVEDSNYGRWNVATLRQVAGALDTWLQVSLEPYGKLVDAALNVSPEALKRPTFEEDPVFARPPRAEDLLRHDKGEGPTAELRRKLLPWLEKGKWSPAPVIDWLQGRDLASLGHEDEPYRWFLRALPKEEPKWDWHRAELTRRLARMIAEEPDVHRPGRRPDEFLSNLFLLTAGLDSPDLLAEPLYDVYRRLRRGSAKLEVGVKDCLLAALTRNQKDLRLYEVWLQMIETGKHDVLPGDEYAGFEGFKRLSPRPSLEDIAHAIKLLERHWRAWADVGKVTRLRDLLAGIDRLNHDGRDARALLDCGLKAGWMQGALEAWGQAFPSGAEVIVALGDSNDRRVFAGALAGTLEVQWKRVTSDSEAGRDVEHRQAAVLNAASVAGGSYPTTA
jgi:transcriptional regulator with XRE-family HTH domain